VCGQSSSLLLQDIQNTINDSGTTLIHCFLDLKCTLPPNFPSTSVPHPLLDSVHYTGKAQTKVTLDPSDSAERALTEFAVLHSILLSHIPTKYHPNVFVEELRSALLQYNITHPNIITRYNRSLWIFDPRLTGKYTDILHTQLAHHKTAEKLEKLKEAYSTSSWTDSHTAQYHTIHSQITQAMLYAES
jgi:hypothetical protein